MHYLQLVTLKNAQSSEEAREKAYITLSNESFASENGGFYGSSKADWFVIGGRWSGGLLEAIGDEKIKKAKEEIAKLLKKKRIAHTVDTLVINPHLIADTVRKEIESKYKKISGIPFFRNTYEHHGYDDDALLIKDEKTAKKIKKHLADYEDLECIIIDDNDYILDDKNFTEIKAKELVGRWLILVDYHN